MLTVRSPRLEEFQDEKLPRLDSRIGLHGGGGNEATSFVASILRMNQRFAPGRYPQLAYEFRIIDGERHAGNQIESYNRGMRFVFAPLAPEQGPSLD